MSLKALDYVKSRSPLKITLAFALGVFLPSGILSFIGLRSYQFESRLMQMETEERSAGVADLVANRVTGRFSELLTALSAIASQPGFQRFDSAHILPVLLSPPKLDGISGSSLFVFDAANRMVAPWEENAQSNGQTLESGDLKWGSLAEDIDRLERMEFVAKDYASAIEGYRALTSKTSSPALQAALLKNIAGDYRRLHDTARAERTYLELARSHDQVMDISGYPMGVLGRQMAIQLYEDDKAWLSALNNRLDLFEGLLYRRWRLPATQVRTLLNDLRSAIEKSFVNHAPVLAPSQPRWAQLQSTQDRLQALEQAGKEFVENDRDKVFHRAHQQGRLDRGAVLQMGFKAAPKLALIVPIVNPRLDQRRGFLVALLPAESVRASINTRVAETTQGSSLQIEWGDSGRPIELVDPPLHFQLIAADVAGQNKVFKRRQRLSEGTIGLSVIVILVGMAIMAQILKREIEVTTLKADFVATVSHELRTPLTAISNIGKNLKLGRYRSEDEKEKIYSLLDQQTSRLRGLIEDILDFSKMLAGKKIYRRDPLDLVVLTQESVDHFEPKAEARDFRVVDHYPSDPIPILGDATAIVQSILNLLDNAMKYSGDSRQIELRVEKANSHGIVAVTDRGIGIAEANQEKIFEKFYRIEDKRSARFEGGVGLGLAMVKHVVEGHAGRIEIKSQLGKGSTFSLIFPLAEKGA